MADFIDEAIEEAQVSMEQSLKEEDVYCCIFTSTHAKMTRNITMEPGHTPPTMGNIIYYYATRAQHLDEYDDILEWADDLGHDLNNLTTHNKFDQLVEDQKDLRLLLGESNYQNMTAVLAISQAISNAAF